MSWYGSQKALNMSRRAGSRGDLTGAGTQHYTRNEVMHVSGGNGYEPYTEGYNTYSYSKSSGGGMMSGMSAGMGGEMMSGTMNCMAGPVISSNMGGPLMSGNMGGQMMSGGGGMMSGGGGMSSGGGGMSGSSSIHQKALILQAQCQEYLKKAEYALQSGSATGEAERYMAMAKENIEHLKNCAVDLRQLGQPNDNVVRSMEICKDQLKGVHMAISGSLHRRRSTRGSSGGWEETGRSYQDAMAWIAQQKRLIETASWGDDPSVIDQQLISHQNFHSSIQRSSEVDRAKDELMRKGDKGSIHALDQEWDSLQQMSFGRTKQLQDLKQIIQDIAKEIMWVNDREEEELMFDWGDKNIDSYIPRKQESYSKLMRDLEDKEKDLNKLKAKVDTLLKNNHPASDKIEAYKDTLQTQWSWLLQITKCIDVHLKENAAYCQFFKEANETYSTLQREHELVRTKFTCDKNTSLENLVELLRGLESEKERIMENKRQVQHLVNKSKSIVRLKPRNPEEKSGSQVIVKALCDFKQDQKVICKDNEAILKDKSQRSKWEITGPGGLDMIVPSVCLIVPPPNPLSVSLANKNEQYYEAILSIWNQLYINIKSLIAWQYCLIDIEKINSLTVTMLSRMRPEEYRQLIKRMETHYEEFKQHSHGSQMFADEDKRSIENQFTGAQARYDQLVVQLPIYIAQQEQIELQQAADQQQLIIIQQQQQAAAEEEARRREEEARRREEERRRAELKKVKKTEVKSTKMEVVRKVKASPFSASHAEYSRSLTELRALRLRVEALEGSLSQHIHISVGEDGLHDCDYRISQLETVQRDLRSIQEEYLRLKGLLLRQLDSTTDADKAQFLRSEIEAIDQRLANLESSSSSYVLRLEALRDMLESMAKAEDIVKVYEARLTEKETTSLSPSEVDDYMLTLETMKGELDQKKDILGAMEADLARANHWNAQVGGPLHRCELMLSRYIEHVGQLSDRWKRIEGQIDTRIRDLQSYQPQLQHYKTTSTSIIDWIDATKKKQDTLEATKLDSIQALTDHISKQKALNSDIKARRETVELVLKDNEACVNAIKDYETDLAAYTSGLETLLNIPIKRTMLKSPSMDLNLEATQLQTRYVELLTHCDDYYIFLGQLLQNMEKLKIRDTRVDLLEEELRLLRDNMQDVNAKNKSLGDTVSRYQLELSNSQEQLLSMEKVSQTSALQCSATKDSLDSTQSKLADLNSEVAHLKYLLEEEKRKTRLAEQRYTTQQEEYELVLRKREKELETVSRSKMEVEKSVVQRDHEIEQLRRQLADEGARIKELQKEISKTTTMMQSIQSQYNEIVNERDALLLKLQLSGNDKDHYQRLEDELSRIKLSLDSELRNKQRIQEENERVTRDLGYWKDQYESKQGLIRQYETDKERLERENNSLQSELEKLMRELRDLNDTYKSRLSAMQKELQEVAIVRKTMETELMRAREPPTIDDSNLVFDGVRKPVTAKQLLDCGVLDKPTFSQLVNGYKTVPDVSMDKKVILKGTGPIAGVVIDGLNRPGVTGPLCKMTFTEAKKENLLPSDSVDLLLDAQAATGHIIDPRTNQKLTVEEACDQGVVDEEDRERLLAAEAAAVGYRDPGTGKPLSVFQAMKKGLIDKNTTLRLLQAQESVGGILDPVLSVFLPKDTAIERNLLNDDIYCSLNQRPELYLDPESEDGVTYISMKRRCRVEPHTGLLLLPISEKVDPSKLVFDGVRKPVTAKQLFDCGVLDKPTLKDLEKGRKNVPEVSADKNVNLKGTGPIAGVIAGSRGKMTLSDAKKEALLPEESADLLLEAQAATGHIIDPRNNQKLTVEEACARGVVDISDRDRLLAAEAAAVGYKDFSTAKPLSVFEAMKKNIIDRVTGLRLLQAQESVGGILDPNLSVFLPKDTAIKRNLLDDNLCYALDQSPGCYCDPETERDASYGALKKRCKTEPHTGLLLLPITEKLDPSKLIFDGVRKPVTAKQLLDCGILDKQTFNQLLKGEKSVPMVSEDKKVFLKGTGPISGVAAGPMGKMSLSEAKKRMLMPSDSADLLLEAQAATGHIIDPTTNQKLTVEEACARRVVDNTDRDRLLAAEAAAVGYRDPSTAKPLSAFEAMKKGLIDRKTVLRLLQAQESAGGILDPNLSVFLPRDTAIKHNLLDENLSYALNQNPECYLDPDTERDVSYGTLMKKTKTESHTGLILLPITERKDPSKLMFDGIRKPVSAQQLFECGILDKPTFDQLLKGDKTVQAVSEEKMVYLKGIGPIAGVIAGCEGKMSFSEAKKQMLMPSESADLLLEAQAATGHIIDPQTNQKLTVGEACAKGVVDIRDQDRLLAAEAAAVGFKDHNTARPLSVFEAMKKGFIDRKTGLRLLQAQESVGGIIDPNLSVFLPKDTAIKRNLLDENLNHALNQSPECYLDPDTEHDISYGTLKKRSKTEFHTGLVLLPITEKLDPSKLVFDGVRKPVTAQQLLDCGILDTPTFNQLMKGEKSVAEVSDAKKVFLKGTGSISGVAAGPLGNMSLSEAKKQMRMPSDSADLLLEAQAATGHIIDPTTNQKLTVEEACARRVVDIRDRERLLAAEAAAVGYRDPSTAKPLSAFEAMQKGLIDRKTVLRLLQAQVSIGGILDPNLSVFLPRDTAIKRNLLDENLSHSLNQSPQCYLDPDTDGDVSYGTLMKRTKTESHTGLILLPITERKDPSKLMFDGIRKPVSTQQLFDCGVLDKPTYDKLLKGEKTVPAVSEEKMVYLKGTGPIAGLIAGCEGKMSFSEAKKQMIMPSESADLLLEAQAATGHIIDPLTNQKLTVGEACAKGVVDIRDRDRLLAAEAAAVGFKDHSTTRPLSVFEAMKKGLIDRKTGLRLLQAQESVGGIIDPNLSVFLPKDTAIRQNLLDENLSHALNQSPECFLDPDTELGVSYGTLKRRGKTESYTGLILLPITERKNPSKLMFDGIRKPVSALQLFEYGVLDKPTFDQLLKGEKTVPAVSQEKMIYLKGTGPIAGVIAGREGKMSFSEAKKQMLLPLDSAYLLLEAQAATGYIIDPKTNQKLTVEEACARGVVDMRDRDRLLVAEAAAVGFKDPRGSKLLSVFEAMQRGFIDRKTGLRLLQAQESVGGIIDPNLSVFLPKDAAIKRNLLDENLLHALNQHPECYLDPETEHDASYGALQERCKIEPQASLQLLPVSEKFDPSKLIFDGARKTVTAQQLLDCGILDKTTFNQLMKGEKTVQEVSVDMKVFLKGTGPVAGVSAGSLGKMSFTEAKRQKMISPESADMLLEAQAATGFIIDPRNNQKLTVKEACARGVVDKEDEFKLSSAEFAATGFKDPYTGQLLSAGQAMMRRLIDKDTALRFLQAQESVGGILDPVLSIFLPKDIARDRYLIDDALYQSLNEYPECYLDPETQQTTTYISLKKKCKADPRTGLLLLPEPKKPLTIQGLRGQVSVIDLVDANLLNRSDMDLLREGRLTSQDIEDRLSAYLRGSTCIAGIYDEANDKAIPIYQAMEDGLLQPETALELLEAQAASGFVIDPVNNHYLSVSDAYSKRLFGPELKDKLLSAERAVTGYKLPGTDKILSLFQAIERGLVEKPHGIHLLEAQIASGGIIDPEHSHRVDVDVAYKRGYFDKEMNKILTDTKGYSDPNTEEKLTYLELKQRCITDKKTGLILLPVDKKKQESTLKNTHRKRRVVIVDPESNKEMTVREAYDKGYIDYDTFLELAQQECEWEEITITAPDGSTRFIVIDRKTGRQYDITEMLETRVIDQSDVDKYRSGAVTLTQFADIISNKTKYGSSYSSSTSRSSAATGASSMTSLSSTSRPSATAGGSSGTSSSLTSRTSATAGGSSSTSSSLTSRTSSVSDALSGTSASSSILSRPLSPSLSKTSKTTFTTITEHSTPSSSGMRDLPDSHRSISGVSISLSSPFETVGEQEPVGAVFDTDVVEKISITEALNRGLVDSITAQRLLEAQACTGGIIDPTNGHRLSIQEASRLGIIDEDMAPKLKPAQKAFFGYDDLKTRKKMSAAQAMKELWLPYEAGHRFLEYQYVTGGLYDPEMGCRRTIEDAVKMGWLDERTGHKLQDVRNHTKNLTCPKSKLKISYKEALDNCLVEESGGLKMLQASSVSSRGISSPYNVASAPGSATGSRSGSRRSSRRSSLDLGSPSSLSTLHRSLTSYTTFSSKSTN